MKEFGCCELYCTWDKYIKYFLNKQTNRKRNYKLTWRGAGGAVSAGSCCVGSIELYNDISTFVDTFQGHLQVALVVPQHQLRVRARAGRLGHYKQQRGKWW